MENQTINLLEILQVGGLAGIISALFSGGIKESFEWMGRKRKARYLALRISLALEAYYNACRDRAYEIEDFHSSRGEVGKNHVGLPIIAEYPADPEAWMYLNTNIVDEILSLPASIQAIDESIYFNVNMDSLPDGPDKEWTLEPLYEMAFRSIDLARRVRSSAGLSNTKNTIDSEIRLAKDHRDFLNNKNKRQKRDDLSLNELENLPL